MTIRQQHTQAERDAKRAMRCIGLDLRTINIIAAKGR
jgi:hypothetical protein